MIECRADEYEECARQLHKAIGEGQSIVGTATLLRLLAAPPPGPAAPLDVERLAHKAAEIGFTYGALGRDFVYVLRNVDDMLAALAAPAPVTLACCGGGAEHAATCQFKRTETPAPEEAERE